MFKVSLLSLSALGLDNALNYNVLIYVVEIAETLDLMKHKMM